jgi:uncharacterized membrane protein
LKGDRLTSDTGSSNERRPRLYLDLAIVWASTALLTTLIFFAPGGLTPWRVALGLLDGLIVPGYLTTVILFPRGETLNSIERWGLTLSLSTVWIMAVTFLYALIHVRLTSQNLSLGLYGLATAGTFGGWLQRWRAGVQSRIRFPRIPRPLMILVGTGLVLALITWGVVGANLSSRYVTLSLTNPQGQLMGYPFQIPVKSVYILTIHVNNPTHASHRMILEVTVNGRLTQTFSFLLKPRQNWIHPFDLPDNSPKSHVVVAMNLYPTSSSGSIERSSARTVWVRYSVGTP